LLIECWFRWGATLVKHVDKPQTTVVKKKSTNHTHSHGRHKTEEPVIGIGSGIKKKTTNSNSNSNSLRKGSKSSQSSKNTLNGTSTGTGGQTVSFEKSRGSMLLDEKPLALTGKLVEKTMKGKC